MSGVPRMMEMYTLIIFRSMIFLDIRPKATNSPKIKESTSVTKNICTDVSMPSPSFCNIILNFINSSFRYKRTIHSRWSLSFKVFYLPIVVISDPNHLIEIVCMVPSATISSNAFCTLSRSSVFPL